jgi:hypothetical protein
VSPGRSSSSRACHMFRSPVSLRLTRMLKCPTTFVWPVVLMASACSEDRWEGWVYSRSSDWYMYPQGDSCGSSSSLSLCSCRFLMPSDSRSRKYNASGSHP